MITFQDWRRRQMLLISRGVAIKRTSIALLSLIALLLVALLVANAIDYHRFHAAIRRVENLTAEDLDAISRFARNAKEHHYYKAAEIPEPFRSLDPISVRAISNLTDVNLYELGQVYLELRIDTSPSNQQLFYFTNSEGSQCEKVIWNQNPEFVKKMNPTGRIVTLVQWGLRERREWIVLSDQIIVIDRSGTAGGEDAIKTTTRIDAQKREEIEAVIHAIDPSTRGKVYQADGVADGMGLHVYFGPAGDAGPDDISISNTWLPALKPLLDSVSAVLPDDDKIHFDEIVITVGDLKNQPRTVRSIAEWKALFEPPPKTPWWCVWRSFIPKQPTDGL